MDDFGADGELHEAFAGSMREDVLEEEEDTGPITQEDCWSVVSAFFQEKGLVTQQIESFNEFVDQTILSIVTGMRPIEVRPKRQYKKGMDATSEVSARGGASCAGRAVLIRARRTCAMSCASRRSL